MGQQQTFRNCRQVRRQRNRPSGLFVMLGIGSVVHHWDIALLGAMIARQPAHQSVDSTRFKGVKSQRVTTFFIVLPDISRNAAGDPFCRLMDGVARQMRVAPATQLRPHRAHQLEDRRLIFQGRGNVLAQKIQCAAAIRAARLFGFQPSGFPGNVADSGPHVGRVEATNCGSIAGSSRGKGSEASSSSSCHSNCSICRSSFSALSS